MERMEEEKGSRGGVDVQLTKYCDEQSTSAASTSDTRTEGLVNGSITRHFLVLFFYYY